MTAFATTTRRRWWTQAACLGVDPDVFFPDDNADLEAARPALAVCEACPVIDVCLADALATYDWHGVRGGLIGDHRRRLLEAAVRTARHRGCRPRAPRARSRS